ncbi:MAG: DUF3866 family protein [Bifidobacteriaceae bacterium]|nr:DUF3866 family protein [Bifidobacteriaceae bacterium]
MVQSIEWARGVVQRVKSARPGAQELVCQLTDDGREVAAIAYTELCGEVTPGAVVLLNLRALSLGLGTGGMAFVVAPAGTGPDAVPDTAPNAPPDEVPEPGGDSGFLVKARYTPLQVVTRGADSPRSPHHALLQRATSLESMPVVVADLHSSLPAICAAITHDAARAGRSPRLVYVMTDGAALPMAFSRTVAQLVRDEVLAATVTAGQAFGGDFEAVSVHSALLTARHVAQADITICIQGPGNLGSDTPWGFSGVAVGDAVNAISVLGGLPVGCLRVSAADPRPRHQGLSHHSLTAYGQVALAPADLAIPRLTGDLAELGRAVTAAAQPLAGRHRLHQVPLDGLMTVLETTTGLSTMGRGLAQDPASFLAAAAAGRLAFRLSQDAVRTSRQ